MSCPRCDGPSTTGLCESCQLERDREFYERRAEEMAGGVTITGPDAEDRHGTPDGGDE